MAGPAISAALSPGRLLARPARHLKCPCSDRVLLTAVPFLRRMTWRLPDTYHLAGHGRGTATFKFYEGRDILWPAAGASYRLRSTWNRVQEASKGHDPRRARRPQVPRGAL